MSNQNTLTTETQHKCFVGNLIQSQGNSVTNAVSFESSNSISQGESTVVSFQQNETSLSRFEPSIVHGHESLSRNRMSPSSDCMSSIGSSSSQKKYSLTVSKCPRHSC